MPILKIIKAANGIPVDYHKPVKLEVDFRAGTAFVAVQSHADEDAALSGLPVAWGWNIPISASVLSQGDDILGAIEVALVGAGMPFEGGTVIVDQSDTLQGARERAWGAIKAARAIAEEGNFIFDGGSYQADKVRINGAVQLAVIAKSNGTAYSETWTLTDNTTRQLDADQVIALGLALGVHVSGVYAKGRALRVAINQADSIEAVNAIRWSA